MDIHTKWCPRCQTRKPVPEFSRNAARHDGLTGYCTVCMVEVQEESRKRKRRELIEFLGGKCLRCGFTDERALQVDHVNGGGAAERRIATFTAQALDRAVRAEPERFQLLCANCNIIKRIEQAEHVGVRVYERVAPTTRTRRGDPDAINRRNADEVLAGYRELLKLVAEREPVERSATKLPAGSWSTRYARCLGCLRDDRPYAAHGLCTACRQRHDRAKLLVPAS